MALSDIQSGLEKSARQASAEFKRAQDAKTEDERTNALNLSLIHI